jgi:hypothetical protein
MTLDSIIKVVFILMLAGMQANESILGAEFTDFFANLGGKYDGINERI